MVLVGGDEEAALLFSLWQTQCAASLEASLGICVKCHGFVQTSWPSNSTPKHLFLSKQFSNCAKEFVQRLF
jgi:cytochrome c553